MKFSADTSEDTILKEHAPVKIQILQSAWSLHIFTCMYWNRF